MNKLEPGTRVRLSHEAGGMLAGREAVVIEPGLKERDGETFAHVRFDPTPETRWLGREFEAAVRDLQRVRS